MLLYTLCKAPCTWVIFTPYILVIFGEKAWGIVGQKAWTIAHGFDRFWIIFTPIKLISINFADERNMQFSPFLTKNRSIDDRF
jgi:hypothetical protein